VSFQPEKFVKMTAPSRDSLKLELAAEILQRFSEFRFVARGTSMLPSIYPGDCLTVRPFGSAGPSRGEIVLCRGTAEWRVHRIVAMGEQGPTALYILRGDALSEDDPPVPGCALLGRVTSVLRRGKPVNFDTTEGLCHRALQSMVRHLGVTSALLLSWQSMLAGEILQAESRRP
jgi:hypothetical protein